MSRTRTRQLARLLACLAALSGFALGIAAPDRGTRAQTAPGGVVVIRSTVPGIPPGALLERAAALKLAPGQQLVVVDNGGIIGRAQGPFEGTVGGLLPAAAGAPAAAPQGSVVSALASMIQERAQLRSELRSGAGGSLTALSSPWAVSVQSDGAGCAHGDRLVLWRGNAGAAATVVIDMGKA